MTLPGFVHKELSFVDSTSYIHGHKGSNGHIVAFRDFTQCCRDCDCNDCHQCYAEHDWNDRSGECMERCYSCNDCERNCVPCVE